MYLYNANNANANTMAIGNNRTKTKQCDAMKCESCERKRREREEKIASLSYRPNNKIFYLFDAFK